jgi:DnaJ-class molecular chaperone
MSTHYDTLNLPKNASFEQIKKQYRKLSLEHHPDRCNGNEEMFKKISEAYQQLSDEGNRKMYDQSLNPPMNLFDALFGGNPEMHMFTQKEMPFSFQFPMHKPQPLLTTVEITLDQAFTGCCIPVEIERQLEFHRARHSEMETIYVDIPCGIDNNESIILPNKGNHVDGMVGDIKVIVIVKNTTKLERRGLDLYYTQSITLKEALCGFTIEIEYLQNKKFKIVNNDFVITPQYKKVVENGGMKRDRNQGQFIITFNIIFPELSSAKIEKLKEIL